jgi:hypothetical protein
VRVGNAAVRYAQHDAWGALLDAAAAHARARRRLSSTAWVMVRRQLDALVVRWPEPDHGIWTLRGEPRHYTTSKVMCWQAAERGARLADLRGRPEQAALWRATAAEITADVLDRGISARGAFKEHYESDELDASLLAIALTGFLPGDDERLRRTVLAIDEELVAGGLGTAQASPGGPASDGRGVHGLLVVARRRARHHRRGRSRTRPRRAASRLAVGREVPERVNQMALARAAGPARAEVLRAVDPLQRAQPCCVAAGIGEAFGSQASKVLPAGSPDARRRIAIVAWSRLAASSASRTKTIPAGSSGRSATCASEARGPSGRKRS